MKVLVTGAGGFIGRPLLERLAMPGREIHAVTAGSPPARAGEIRWHRCDLLDGSRTARLSAEVRASHLVHLAWITEPGIYWESPANGEWSRASASLFEAFASNGGERIVALGTCAEYDWTSGGALTESSPVRPATRYGRDKAATHEALASLAERAGLEYCWARLFLLYGPGEKRGRLVSDAITGMLRGETVTCNNPAAVRDFLHVNDVAAAIAALIDSKVAGPVNLCSADPTRVGDVVAEIARLVGRPELAEMAPEGRDNSVVVGSNEKLKAETGWIPQIPLRQGLSTTIEWWRGRALA